MMRQWAPWPEDLEAAVSEVRGYQGWTFTLADIDRDYLDEARTVPVAGGLTFIILVPCQDSYHPEFYRPVQHYHPVPAATYNRAAWERWIFDRIQDTQTHEAGEWIRFKCQQCDGTGQQPRGNTDGFWRVAAPRCEACGGRGERRPFAALHGPGDNPYVVHELATVEQRATSYRGVRNQ